MNKQDAHFRYQEGARGARIILCYELRINAIDAVRQIYLGSSRPLLGQVAEGPNRACRAETKALENTLIVFPRVSRLEALAVEADFGVGHDLRNRLAGGRFILGESR